MKAGQLRNEQLMLQSFPSYCRRAMVQLGLYRKTEAQTDAKFSAVEAHTGRKKLLFQAELDADELYGERALRGAQP
jgi:predicted deacylase